MKELEVVAGVILHEGKVLCMQRAKSKYAYVSLKFEFPGGKIESAENPVDALKRELMEEMELPVEVLDEVPYLTVHHTYPDFIIHMHAYRCAVKKLVYTLNDHVDAKLLAIPDLKQLDWAPADVPIVDKLMKDAVRCPRQR
jgi:8-oxo-dGTP diphosphatase